MTTDHDVIRRYACTRGTKQTVESVTQHGTTSVFEVRISESRDGDHAAAQD